jgi:hypothetical protein
MPDQSALTPNSFLNSMQDLDFEIPYPRTTSRTEHNRSQSWSSTALHGLLVPKYLSVHSRSASMDTCSISSYQTPFIKQTQPTNLSALEGPLVTPNSYIAGYLDDLEINVPADIRNAPFMTDYEQGSHARSQSWSAGTYTLESKVSNTNSAPILGFRTIEYSQDAEISMGPPLESGNHPREFLQGYAPRYLKDYKISALNIEYNDASVPPQLHNVSETLHNPMPALRYSLPEILDDLTQQQSPALSLLEFSEDSTAISSSVKINHNTDVNVKPTQKRRKLAVNSKRLAISTNFRGVENSLAETLAGTSNYGSEHGEEPRKIKKNQKDDRDPVREAYLQKQRETDRLRRMKLKERESFLKTRIHDLKKHNEELRSELRAYNLQIEHLLTFCKEQIL